MSNRSELGPRVRAARRRLGWSREALAFHAGVSWSAIAQVETGRRVNVRPSTLVALSHALGVTIDYLLEGSPSSPAMLAHSVFAYHTDDEFQSTIGAFLAEGLRRSEGVLAVTTAGNCELLREHLGADASGVEFAESSAWYRTPLAALAAFRSFADASLDGGAQWVRIVGEPVWAERSDAEVRLWTRYESMFNLLFGASPFTVVCPYDERSVAREIVRDAHLTHPYTMCDHGSSENPGYTDPERFAFAP